MLLRRGNGDKLQNLEEAIYLGTAVTKKVDPLKEMQRIISMTMPILKKLYLFWKDAQCNKKLKILVYQAVITTKLLYGLEALCPCVSTTEKLNTFQLNGFRKILEIQLLLLTDEFIYNKCNKILSAPQPGDDQQINHLLKY
jgi:hypothetical protein